MSEPIRLQSFIARAGVASRRKAEQMIADAKLAADEIRLQAKTEAKTILTDAKSDADTTLRAGNEALAQAGRDLILGLKREIEALFKRVTEEATSEALKGAVLEEAIVKTFDKLLDEEGVELVMNQSDADALSVELTSKLAAKIKGGVTITPSNRISSGFRVTIENGAAFYDFTPTEIAEVLSAFLNPSISKLLAGDLEGSGE